MHVRQPRLHRPRNLRPRSGRTPRPCSASPSPTRRLSCSTSRSSRTQRIDHGVPTDRRQHLPDAGQLPPVRVRRRHRHARHHQVHGRPRLLRGRRDRRLRQLRLDGPCRQVPGPDHARRLLPRRHLRQGLRPRPHTSPRPPRSSCATSAPLRRQSIRGSWACIWSRSACAWSATARTHWPWPSGSTPIRASAG